MSNSPFPLKDVYKIPGFLHPVDAFVFGNILEDQFKRGNISNTAEIGVFYGRSFLLLCRYASSQCNISLGIDLFDIPGQRSSVEEILIKQDLTGAAHLIQSPSENISQKDFVKEHGKLRFLHIDGGHERHHLMADMAFALETMDEDCVIVFDDFMNAQYPDLSVAIIDSLRNHSDVLSPFAITKSKLYVCRSEHSQLYQKASSSFLLPRGASSEKFLFLDREIYFFNQSIVSRAIYENILRINAPLLTDFFISDHKRKNARQ